MKAPELWFADYNKTYNKEGGFTCDISQLEITRALESKHKPIISELQKIWLKKNELNNLYGEYGGYDDKQSPPNSLRKIVFKVWGINNKRVNREFPFTASVINSFQDVTSCSLNKLPAHTDILPHCGETNSIIRIHFGLKIPSTDPAVCAIEVGKKIMAWENGKAIGFLDARIHRAWNHADEDRYILMIDILRPEFRSKRSFICSRIIISQLYFTFATKINKTFLYRIPSKLLDIITYMLIFPIQAIIRLNDKWGFLKL